MYKIFASVVGPNASFDLDMLSEKINANHWHILFVTATKDQIFIICENSD